MTISASEHVLFLSNRAFDISTARHVGIGHVEHGETDTVSRSHVTGDLPPIVRMHLHLAGWLRCLSLCPPVREVRGCETMIAIGWVLPLEGCDRLPQNGPPTRRGRITEEALVCRNHFCI